MKIFDIKNIQGQNVLVDNNDNPVQCPFRSPVVLPHPQLQGQAMIVNPTCSDQCPFFEQLDDIVMLHCCKRTLTLKNTKVHETRPKDTAPGLSFLRNINNI